ncbi:MAG TPA: protein kinase [Candidatus Eisenbacteria bacterium]
MPPPGSTLGPYRLEALLGAGGMGEVYRALDTRLGRSVAIKVLSRHLAATAEARARFEREARTVSQLNHPNIATLFDVGQEGDTDYLVMEFLEGETLADRLVRGPLPTAEFLALAGPIVDALAAAHRAGVIHRDLKPGNVMLTAGGPKLLDFGLARPLEGVVTDASSSQSPTVNAPLTGQGVIVGTLQYMAPEQLEGREVDARTDVFALGCVLFEMATGRKAFAGDTNLSIVGSILHAAPTRLHQGADDLPGAVRSLIERCLARDPAARPADGGMVAAELAGLGDWVRLTALPKLAALVDGAMRIEERSGCWEAWHLAREVERLTPDDPLLARLWPEFTNPVTFESEPPGAAVTVQFYGTPGEPWVPLGTTPITVARMPRGIYRVRLEARGVEPVEDVIWNIDFGMSGASDPSACLWRYVMRPTDELPEGMVEVPAGQFPLFMPGLDHLDAEAIDRFWMDRHPVTNRRYREFVAAGGYREPSHWRHDFMTADGPIPREAAMARFVDTVGAPGPAGWEFGEFPAGEDDHPVTGISWYEAAAYAAWRGCDLPTIFHWNWVAFTVASSQIVPRANFGGKGLMPVGATTSMNRFGVHDLAGNVREWALNDADRPGERFILGGAWSDADYTFTDAVTRNSLDRSEGNGFRCIRRNGVDPNAARLERTIDMPFRDFRKEEPVPDAVFEFFRRQFQYDRTPLNARIVADEPGPFSRRQTVEFDAAYGRERVTAYLYLPENSRPPHQAVVIFPGSFALHTAEFTDAEIRRADYILKSGRALIHPVYKATYHRRDGFKSDYPSESADYRDHVIMWAKDLSRTIDWLATRDDIDAEKLAYFGLSWGGALGAILPADEPRFKAVLLYVAGFCFQRCLPEVDAVNYAGRVRQPVLMLNGEHDFFFPLDTSQRPLFEALGAPPGQKRQVIYPGGHTVPRTEIVKEVLAWLDRYLGPVG